MIKGQTKPASNCRTVSWRTLLPRVLSFEKQHWPVAAEPCRELLSWGSTAFLPWEPGSSAAFQALQQGKVMAWQGSTEHSKTNCTSWFSPSRIGKYPPNWFISHCSRMKPSHHSWPYGRSGKGTLASFNSPQVWAGVPECVEFVKSDSLISHLLE